MTKFKVGDRVKVIKREFEDPQIGAVGTVRSTNSIYPKVDFPDYENWTMRDDELKLIDYFESLCVGDTFSNPGVSFFRTIKAKLEDIYFVQDSTDEVISIVTAAMLKERGWMPLVDDEDEPDYQEMTVEEVSKLVGKTVKIVEKA